MRHYKLARDRRRKSSRARPSFKIPAGGWPISPRRRPETVPEESAIPVGSNQNVENDPPLPPTGHNETAGFADQIGPRPPGVPPIGQEPVDRYKMDSDVLEELDYPFLITSEDRLSFVLMEREGLFRHPDLAPSEVERLTDRHRRRSTVWDPERNMLPGESRTEMRKRNEVRLFFERFTLGVFGGLAIIAPMLIMALSNSLVISLVVTSVTTMLFAVLLALPMLGGGLDGQTVLAAVAAYAAILVVFVGTSVSVT